MILHIGYPKEYTKQLLELLNKLSEVVVCEKNVQRPIVFYTVAMRKIQKKLRKQFYLQQRQQK